MGISFNVMSFESDITSPENEEIRRCLISSSVTPSFIFISLSFFFDKNQHSDHR